MISEHFRSLRMSEWVSVCGCLLLPVQSIPLLCARVWIFICKQNIYAITCTCTCTRYTSATKHDLQSKNKKWRKKQIDKMRFLRFATKVNIHSVSLIEFNWFSRLAIRSFNRSFVNQWLTRAKNPTNKLSVRFNEMFRSECITILHAHLEKNKNRM